MAAGALGFSTTTLAQHIGFQRPAARLPARQPRRAQGLRQCAQGTRQGRDRSRADKPRGPGVDDEYELLDLLLTESGRPVTWLAMASRPDNPEHADETLKRLEPLIKRGGVPQVLCKPFVVADRSAQPVHLRRHGSVEPRLQSAARSAEADLRRSGVPRCLPQGADEAASVHRQVASRRDARSGESRAQAAGAQEPSPKSPPSAARDPLDTFLDLALEDDLNIQYTMAQYHEDGIERLISDPRTMIGLSDGGAHVDMLCDAGYCTYLLGKWVRERQALTLEHAVKRITSEPADFFGIQRSRTAEAGMAADIAIFDSDTVDSAKRAQMQHDLPGGGRRLVMPAEGIEYTVVNGQVLYEHGRASGAMPGQVLRSGQC